MNNADQHQQAFSEKQIDSAVTKNSIQHPLVLYPATFGVLGGLASVIIGANLVTYLALGGGLALASGTLATNLFFRRDHLKNLYIRRIHAKIVKEREQRLDKLHDKLEQLNCDRAVSQIERLKQKFELLQRVLGDKLHPGELAHERYSCISEQVFLSALDNLQAIAGKIESVQAIDPEFIKTRLSELNSNASANAAEIESLKARENLYHQQFEESDELLAHNEAAMTKIDATTAALSNIVTKKGHASVDMETAMSELERMANRAQDYSIS